MKTEQPEEIFETLSDAARRLLAKMDERLKRPAAERAAEIHASPDEWSLVPGERGEEAAPGKAAAPSPVARRWAWGGVKMRQGLELNVLFIQTHANLNDDDWLW